MWPKKFCRFMPCISQDKFFLGSDKTMFLTVCNSLIYKSSDEYNLTASTIFFCSFSISESLFLSFLSPAQMPVLSSKEHPTIKVNIKKEKKYIIFLIISN